MGELSVEDDRQQRGSELLQGPQQLLGVVRGGCADQLEPPAAGVDPGVPGADTPGEDNDWQEQRTPHDFDA
jgi:hypothetical protein